MDNTLNLNKFFASGDLEGKTVNGWKIIEKIAPPDKSKNETGGNFSTCYKVEKAGVFAFMKVLDYSKILRPGQQNPTLVMQQASTEFNYEKNLSELCMVKRVSKVVHYIDSGDVSFDGYLVNGDVSFIVYEMADGDVRKVMDLSSRVELAAKISALSIKLKSLHDVSVGINQLHNNSISHQDIKPSNILSFKGESKIGDLGRSLIFDQDIACPYPLRFNGDRNYASPECFFPSFQATQENLYQVDNYMLGGLITFYITGVTFNVLLHKYLPHGLQFLQERQVQNYQDIVPDMINAYQQAIKDFESEIPIEAVKTGLVSIVSYLCFPDPARRGHPRVVESKLITPNYDLHRTINELDILQQKAELALIKK